MHEEIRSRLLRSIDEGKIFPSIILVGQEGVGKKTLARQFAMAVHCEGTGEKPCYKCPSCIKHKTGNHPDYREVVPEEKKKTISVDLVRGAMESLYIRPLISDKKIIFIPEADLCEKAPQNAMLKSFEEPPSYGIIILAVKNLSSLLPTIQSRAVIYHLNPQPREEIESFIKEKYPQKANLSSFLAYFSEGIIGKALALCENEEFCDIREKAISHLLEFTKSNYRAFELIDFFKENQDKEGLLFDIALSFFRDMAAIKEGSGVLLNSDVSDKIKEVSENLGKTGVLKGLFMLTEARNDKSKNANYDLWITNLFLVLWEVIHG